MKTWLCILSIFIGSRTAYPATYYISSSHGSDLHSVAEAQHQESGWKTLEKLQTMLHLLKPGDSVLLKRDDVFEGQLKMSCSGTAAKPITIGAYGAGKPPIITGFKMISGFKLQTGGIWETVIDSTINEIGTVLINGRPQPLSRYPNAKEAGKACFFVSSFLNEVVYFDNDKSTGDWRGAELVVATQPWLLERKQVGTSTHGRFSLIPSNGRPVYRGNAFFIQNHRLATDLDGEWYFESGNHTLGIKSGRINPGTLHTQITAISTLLDLSGCSYIHIQEICLEGSSSVLARIQQCNGIKIVKCQFKFAGTGGVLAKKTSRLDISASIFDRINDIGIEAEDVTELTISDNQIRHCGSVAGIGGSISGSYQAIMVSGDSIVITKNQIDSSGYNAITFAGNRIYVKANRISHFGFIKTDGAGIYTWNNKPDAVPNHSRFIQNNIVSDGGPAAWPECSAHPNFVNGIYIDDHSNDVTVTGNTIAHCAQYGIYLHNAAGISISKNKVFDNLVPLAVVQDKTEERYAVRYNRIRENVLTPRSVNKIPILFKGPIKDSLQIKTDNE